MMLRALPILLLMLCSSLSQSQNYIGLHKDRIREQMALELPSFRLAKEVLGETKRFVKYENPREEETIIFVLNKNFECIAVSRMYNTWLINQVKSSLDGQYRKVGKLKWEEVKDGKRYDIILVKGEWYITVTTRPQKR